jgi:5-methylcytosine-specific restriction endonuclease McrA
MGRSKVAKHQRSIGTQRWKNLRLTILARDGYTCYACGGEANQVDHIYPRAKGGDTFDPLNCAAICAKCNGLKGDRFFSSMPTPPVFIDNISPMRSVQHQDSPFTARPIGN